MISINLTRAKHKPGSAAQRFGEWQKGEPTVILDNQKWLAFGKPDELTVLIDQKTLEKRVLGDLTTQKEQNNEKIKTLCR